MGATPGKPVRVLAVCSGGGHWIQMQRLRPAFAGHDVTYATVLNGRPVGPEGARVLGIPDANKDTKLRLAWLLLRLTWIILRVRPRAVVTTGAAPGYLAVRLGKMLVGAKTLYLDSVANADRLSLSGQMAVGKADVTLTQWPHLECEGGPTYRGAVL